MSKGQPDPRVHPNKRFGQHFLRDEKILARIAGACAIAAADTVVEVGAGTGELTRWLARTGARVIAIEKDRTLVPLLAEHTAPYQNVEVVEQDVLRFDPSEHGVPASYVVCGNIPYYITGAIMELVLERWPQPARAVFLVQKEVAYRICAKPGELSILGALTQLCAAPRIVQAVSRNVFFPKPRVDSAILELAVRPKPAHGDFERIKTLIKAGFSHPRKYCLSNVAEVLGIPKPGVGAVFDRLRIARTARAQEFALEEWRELSTLLKPFLS